MTKFRCNKDYYDCLVSGKSAERFYREQDNQLRKYHEEREATEREMNDYRERYGD